nr:flagellar basal body rod protein FlgB [Pseudovibrio stylochi]
MDPVYLFSLASRKTQWLSVRQTAVAENIANADTPGYAAKDVEPFRDVFDKTHLENLGMRATQAGHLQMDGSLGSQIEAADSKSWQVSVSKNSVSLEQEMIKSGQVAREYSLTTGIVGKFHSLTLASLSR